MIGPGRLVSIAVPIPALDVLTYRIPPDMDAPSVGARVVVPLGPRTLTGIALGEAAPSQPERDTREILEVLDREPFLPPDVIDLAQWVAEYYIAGPGATLAKALPPHALRPRPPGFKTTWFASLTPEGRKAASMVPTGAADPHGDPGRPPVLGARQREALALLSKAPGGLSAPALGAQGIPASVLGRLATLQLITLQQQRLDRDPFSGSNANVLPQAEPGFGRDLTAEQQAALERLGAQVRARIFGVTLLHGVTGSGKTEIYLRLADDVRRQGRGALILVPEIALTPALASAFRERFGERTAIQHSGLSHGERHDQWHRIRRGDVDVVVGTRSAVFAPLSAPGLIVVDEEHDPSYKQEETPRYHGRDVAVMRGKLAGALVVLGSATPSMESFQNATEGRYVLVSLEKRVMARALADVRIVNMREEYAAEGPDVVLSRSLRDGIASRLERKEQALVLLNRRGFATAVLCRQCGDTLECPNCSISLTVHTGAGGQGRSSERHPDDRSRWRARCHYCNYARAVPTACRHCAAPYLEHIGFGTERVEAELVNAFPGIRAGRIDRDTVQRRGQLTRVLDQFRRGALDVLVGTQMIAKGHDFPLVTLVGVISADVGLAQADFRAAERTFQLLTQVAGRAGRGDRPGEALVQTLYPSHYSIRLACQQDYSAFFEQEIRYRRAMHYPPLVAMVNVVVRGRTAADAMAGARELSSHAAAGPHRFSVLGPAPAPLTRLRGEHRAQFFLKGPSRKSMRTALRAALAAFPDIARKTSVDVDPVSVL